MSAPKPYEAQVLERATKVLDEGCADHESRLDVLEAASSRLGGFRLNAFRGAFPERNMFSEREALRLAEKVLDALNELPIHPALALSALARPSLSATEQRRSGAYYTDFRLARLLAEAARDKLSKNANVIDPASGTGMLLVASALVACGSDRIRTTSFLRSHVYAADLSPAALRGARLALAALTDDLSAVTEMVKGWRSTDSLLAGKEAWAEVAPHGFDVVIGNPPWEKLKVSRHEFLRSDGVQRHYGDDYTANLDVARYASEKSAADDYGAALARRYSLLGSGEPDLYKAFLELFVRLARKGGCVSALVPAGLIRSQGTLALREFMLDATSDLRLTVIENRARFFAIDTRFKFLAVRAIMRDDKARRSELAIAHAVGTNAGVRQVGIAHIGRTSLRNIRPDLTLPEVKSDSEWRIFRKMTSAGPAWGDPAAGWSAVIVREVDMTRDRKRFERSCSAGRVPLVEGRMVHQHRFGAKRYVSGTGRRARWETLPLGQSAIAPQFWFPKDALTGSLNARMNRMRVGFCDITGQTNERSMLAALVPPGVICGNKVPTITFADDDPSRLFLWLAIANSVPFDWMLRRVVTTTVNYFVLLSLPLPSMQPDGLPARRLATAAKTLHEIDSSPGNPDPWRAAELRAGIDIATLAAYDLGLEDLWEMLHDFPLLDRAQPPLPGETRSTVTRDLLMWRAAQRFDGATSPWKERLEHARSLGAVPYVPSEFGPNDVGDDEEEAAHDG